MFQLLDLEQNPSTPARERFLKGLPQASQAVCLDAVYHGAVSGMICQSRAWASAVLLVSWMATVAGAGELDVTITEVHFNVFRSGAETELEFVEIQNRGPVHVDVGGWRFVEGIEYTFPSGELLAPGEHVVVCASPQAARGVYGLDRALGPFTGRLDNNGEILSLVNERGHVVNRVHFDDDAPWPSRPDGRGPSLELIDRRGGNDSGLRWKPSAYLDGTPGAPNSRLLPRGERVPAPGPYIGGVINEVKAPEGADSGFIELFNPLESELDLSGHSVLSDGYDFIFEIPAATILAPGELISFSGAVMDLRLPEVQRRYALLAADGRTLLDDLVARPLPGRGCGRYPDGDPDVHALDAPSPGAPNEYTEDRRIVVNEICYHPPFVAPDDSCAARCSDALQWIELHNPGADAVDLGGWRLTNGVRFDLDGLSIEAGGYLVVAADAGAFAAAHPGVSGVAGNWSGRLSHASETIVLRNALGNPVDRVRYADGGPTNDENPQDGVDDLTFRGSFWAREPDGEGPTLELVHPGLSNRAAVAWRASSSDGGTPGRRNSRHDPAPAPTVRDVEHEPVVPAADEPVRVTCRISSVASLDSAVVRWAVDGGGGSGTVNLVDDGSGEDRIAGDGEFAALIPGRSDGQIIRFSIEVEDSSGESLRVPLEPQVEPHRRYPGTFYLYEVDDDVGPATGGPVYRIIMTDADVDELDDRSVRSNVLLPATLIADGRVRHLVGVRYRGENSRRETNRSYKVRLQAEASLHGVDNINLNAGNGGNFGTSGFNEVLAMGLFRRAEMPYPMTWPISLHFTGEVRRDFDRRYVHKEAFDEKFLARYFGGSDDGNLYRPRNPRPGGASGDLSYEGSDPDDYRDLYEKRSNEDLDDFSDIIELCRVFDPQRTGAGEFEAAMDELVDARQWARFFAVMGCLSNTDGGIWNDNGEDFFMYRVADDSSRPDAGRWLLLPWDVEETFQDFDEELFHSSVDSIERFFSVPKHTRLYYEELRRVADGAFSRSQMRQRYESAERMFASDDVYDAVDDVDTNVTMRLGYIDSRVSWSLDVGAEGTGEPSGTPLVPTGTAWRYFRGIEQPPGGDLGWTRLDYDDDAWQIGESGFGYGDGDDATVLRGMEDSYTTVFARRGFAVEDPDALTGLTLRVDYDDAYVAYINGTEVARSSTAPGGVINFDHTATDSHESSSGQRRPNPIEERDLTDSLDLLRPGDNVLAVVGLNVDVGSGDFSLHPSLSAVGAGEPAGGPAGGAGESLYAVGQIVRLRGVCNPVTTRSISIDGVASPVSLVIGDNGPWGARWSQDVVVGAAGGSLAVRAHSEPDGAGLLVETFDVVIHRVPVGFTEVEGDISGDEVWGPGAGPYHLTDDLTIGPNDSLTIEPGTVVLADRNASITVRGEFSAVGRADLPIVMLAFQRGSNWGGIAFDRSGRGGNDPLQRLEHVRIRDGSTADGFEGCVAARDAKVLVSDCEISDVPANAIDSRSAELTVLRSHIHDIFEGVHCVSSTATISECVIENMTGNSDAIDFDGSGEERSLIERCVLRGSMDDGIDLGGVSVDVRDNILDGIEDKAISIEDPGEQGNTTITGNLIVRSGTGMAIKNGVEIREGDHNTVVGCQEGIWLFAKDESPRGGSGLFRSTIVWGNVIDVLVDEDSSVDFEYSDVAGEDVASGDGNILADPMFVDPTAGNYALRPGSPCIGTAFEGEDMGAIPADGPPAVVFLRGDVNLSGEVDVSDVVAELDHLFRGAPGPTSCRDILDVNDDGVADVSDAVYTLRYLFSGGPRIPAPFPRAGVDPTEDELACER